MHKSVSKSGKTATSKKNTSWLKKIGPGLITGAADDDPSGIATYSQAGAQFGFSMLWTIWFTYPLMAAIQIICARIGRVSGRGLATHMRRHYPAWLLYSIVGLLLLANTINIAADLSAMGDALKLVAGGSSHLYAVGFGIASILLQVFIPYSRYVNLLKWLTLALFAYVATVFVVDVPWTEVATRAVLPHATWKPEYVTTVVAVFGTTISPYLFFWQASQEVEEQRVEPNEKPLIMAPAQADENFRRINIDTYLGMGFSNLIAFFVILTTAVTLHLHGHTDIQNSAQAAKALRPIAGDFAFFLFSMGIIGTGMLAIPVLAGSAAYAMSGAFNWKNSLELEPAQARKFYAVIVISILVGIAIGFTPVDPIKALYWSAVINGVISVPIMTVMMLMAASAQVMGRFTVTGRLKFMGWLATAIMAAAVCAMFWTMAH
jgi:NRAMP (natural resistance-associated macrophage protein)-like metal ion transporter